MVQILHLIKFVAHEINNFKNRNAWYFFGGNSSQILAVHTQGQLSDEDVSKLEWLFSGAKLLITQALDGYFVGPRREMITPWSTNAVEITQNMDVRGILRIEEFFKVDLENALFDGMLQKSL